MNRVSFYMQIIWVGMFCQSGNYINRGCLPAAHPAQIFSELPPDELIYTYSRLSRLCLSRITAYLEVKIWSLCKHANLTTGIYALCSNFSSFLQYCQYISNFRSQITYSFVKIDCLIYFFHYSANLICRGSDISKYFRESVGLRNNENRLWLYFG